MRGLDITDNNPVNFCAVRLHYTADPAKDPENPDPELAASAQAWITLQKAIWPDPSDWEREYECNFHLGSGARVFPQFGVVHMSTPNPAPYKVI